MSSQKNLNEPQLVDLLRLYSIRGIGSVRLRNLMAVFGDPANVLRAPIQRLISVQGIEKSTAFRIKSGVDEKYVQRQLTYLAENHIQVLHIWDKSYPESLKRIFDPPSVLFVKGEIRKDDQMAIAVVGTRYPTIYGTSLTAKITADLAKSGITIISGLARGVDTVAHRTALENGARTIAVLGSGHDIIYPGENKKLSEQIAEHGAVISEFPPGTFPDPGNFPRRNRIVSGLSVGVLVTEAGPKSGAIITAFEALEQNREVFAVPGPVNSKNSIGTNRLIKEGAKLVQDVSDIINELESGLNLKMTIASAIPDLAEDERRIYDLVTDAPVHIDQLTLNADKMTSEVLSVLLTLELMGLVKQLSGKMFIRI